MKKVFLLFASLGMPTAVPSIDEVADYVLPGTLKLKAAELDGDDSIVLLVHNSTPTQSVSNINTANTEPVDDTGLQSDYNGWNYEVFNATAGEHYASKLDNPRYDSSLTSSIFNNPEHIPANYRTAYDSYQAYKESRNRVLIA